MHECALVCIVFSTDKLRYSQAVDLPEATMGEKMEDCNRIVQTGAFRSRCMEFTLHKEFKLSRLRLQVVQG